LLVFSTANLLLLIAAWESRFTNSAYAALLVDLTKTRIPRTRAFCATKVSPSPRWQTSLFFCLLSFSSSSCSLALHRSMVCERQIYFVFPTEGDIGAPGFSTPMFITFPWISYFFKSPHQFMPARWGPSQSKKDLWKR